MAKIQPSLDFVILIAWTFAFAQASQNLTVGVIYSDEGSQKLSQELIEGLQHIGNSNSIILLSAHQVPLSSLQAFIVQNQAYLLIDATSSFGDSLELMKIAEQLEVPVLVQNQIKSSTLAYNFDSTDQQTSKAIQSLLKALDWSAFNYCLGIDQLSRVLVKSFDKSLIVTEQVILKHLSALNVNRITGRIIKASGVNILIVSTDYSMSNLLQNSLILKKLWKKPFGTLFFGQSTAAVFLEGALIIQQAGFEHLLQFSYEIRGKLNAVQNLLNELEPLEQILSPIAVKKVLQKLSEDQIFPYFDVINVQQGQRIRVGCVHNDVAIIQKNIVFPGGSQEIPKPQQLGINISFGSGISNGNGTTLQDNGEGFKGAKYGLSAINQSFDLLPNFTLNYKEFDCGCTFIVTEDQINCFNERLEDLGIAYIPPFVGSAIPQTFESLNSLNSILPMVGAINNSSNLSKISEYPYHVRIKVTSDFLCAYLAFSFQLLHWKHINVVYNDDTYEKGFYDAFANNVDRYGITITNREEFRKFDKDPEIAKKQQFQQAIQEIKKTKVRLLALFISQQSLNEFVPALYDYGFRKGDLYFIVIQTGWFQTISFQDSNENIHKFRELVYDSFLLDMAVWNGKLGAEVYDSMQLMYSAAPINFSCYFYDAVHAIAYAIDWNVLKGNDNEDKDILMDQIRQSRFNGCTGLVTFQEGTNDREADVYDLFQLQEEKGVVKVSEISPFSSVLIKYIEPITYNGSFNKPSDIITNEQECAYAEEDINFFPNGIILCFSISIFILVITITVTFYIWKRWWSFNIQMLSTSSEIQVNDTIVITGIFIEFLQYLSQGPDFDHIIPFINQFSSAVSLQLENIISMQGDGYWTLLYSMQGLVGFWTIFSVFIIWRLDLRFERFFIVRMFDDLGQFLMPIIGNLCYLPVISILLSVFICDKATEDSFSTSYMQKDCNQQCWTSFHCLVSIISGFCLILYVPFSTYMRPLWQEFQAGLTIRAFPRYLMVKSVFQSLIVVIRIMLKEYSELAHGVLHSAFMGLFLIFIFKRTSFNYGRVNVLLALSIMCVLFQSIVSTLSFIVLKGYFNVWMIILIIGWFLICSIMVFVMYKYHVQYLYRKPAKDIRGLYRFAFTCLEKDNFSDLTPKLNLAANQYSTENAVSMNYIVKDE